MGNVDGSGQGTAQVSERVSHGVRTRAQAASWMKFAFYIHLAFYLGVNLLLFFINAMTTPLIWWVLWPIAGWGFALLVHAVVSFLAPDLFGVRRRMYEDELSRQINKKG